MRETRSLDCICIYFMCLITMGLVMSCSSYRLTVSELRGLPETEQTVDMQVSDDGTVTFIKNRLEISVRPITVQELNRQFVSQSQAGGFSTNPYTYGDWKDPGTGRTPERFTVFRLKVKNYGYPKIKVDPLRAVIIADNGRTYNSLSLHDLQQYYAPYSVGHGGNAYARYEERRDILKQTLYPGHMLFSGQEAEGYVVFPRLHDDVEQITFWLEEMILRFNVTGEPIETIDVQFLFGRTIERVKLTGGTVPQSLLGPQGKESSK